MQLIYHPVLQKMKKQQTSTKVCFGQSSVDTRNTNGMDWEL